MSRHNDAFFKVRYNIISRLSFTGQDNLFDIGWEYVLVKVCSEKLFWVISYSVFIKHEVYNPAHTLGLKISQLILFFVDFAERFLNKCIIL